MIILLDIDGVLVTTGGWKKQEILSDNFAQFNLIAVENLNRLILETNASILLTSSHRNKHTSIEWKRIFETRGIRVSDIESIKKGDSGSQINRAALVTEWINKSGKKKHFVIIDDDTSLYSLPSFIQDKCVITKPLIGLGKPETEKAINILKEQKSA